MREPMTLHDLVREAARQRCFLCELAETPCEGCRLEAAVAQAQAAANAPSADIIQAVREMYRDDPAAMADSLLRLRADLAEARRTKTEDR